MCVVLCTLCLFGFNHCVLRVFPFILWILAHRNRKKRHHVLQNQRLNPNQSADFCMVNTFLLLLLWTKNVAGNWLNLNLLPTKFLTLPNLLRMLFLNVFRITMEHVTQNDFVLRRESMQIFFFLSVDPFKFDAFRTAIYVPNGSQAICYATRGKYVESTIENGKVVKKKTHACPNVYLWRRFGRCSDYTQKKKRK